MWGGGVLPDGCGVVNGRVVLQESVDLLRVVGLVEVLEFLRMKYEDYCKNVGLLRVRFRFAHILDLFLLESRLTLLLSRKVCWA